MTRRFLMAAAVAAIISFPAAALAADVTQFDIAGVRLLMLPEDVSKALTARGYQMRGGQALEPCTQESIDAVKVGKSVMDTATKSCIDSQRWTDADLKAPIDVSYVEDYPAHPGVMRVAGIRITPAIITPADRVAFINYALAKFGTPTVRDMSKGDQPSYIVYCTGVTKARPCLPYTMGLFAVVPQLAFSFPNPSLSVVPSPKFFVRNANVGAPFSYDVIDYLNPSIEAVAGSYALSRITAIRVAVAKTTRAKATTF